MKTAKMTGIAICIFSLVFTFSCGIKNIKGKGESVKEGLTEKTVLSVWQIDGFSGGKGSRREFLLSVAKQFEKKENVLILVNSHTLLSAEENIKKGIFPDLISFSNGLKLSGFNALNSDKNFSPSALSKTQFFLPWCRNSYILFTNENAKGETLTVSTVGFTLPELTLLEENRFEKIVYKENQNAYSDFVSGLSKYFLGTIKDALKLNNRGFSYEYKILDGFSDLFQYIGNTAKDNKKREYGDKFINFLLSEKMQERLCEIGLCSPYYKVKSDIKIVSEVSDSFPKSTLSPFYDKNKISIVKELSHDILSGKGDVEKIKKELTYLS